MQLAKTRYNLNWLLIQSCHPCSRYYKKEDLKNFENIECEWPLFYIFMIIDGVFKNLPDQISEYQDLLKKRIFLDHNEGMAGKKC